MLEQLHLLLSKISSLQLSILFLLGLALLGGTIGARLLERMRIPQVVGFIVVGILIGKTGLNIVHDSTLQALEPFNYFALGLIGFTIGGELKKQVLVKYGKRFVSILLSEGIFAFLLAGVLISVFAWLLIADIRLACSLGLILGAIASATAPAATTDVLWQYKTRGPLTTTILGIVALDDGLALVLFAVASSIGLRLVGGVGEGAMAALLHPIYEIGGSILIGAVSGFVLSRYLRKCHEEERILASSIAAVLLVLGIALIFKVDTLMASMSLGVMITNHNPRKSKEVFRLFARFTPPIYVLFFVLFGAKLDLSRITLPLLVLAVVYFVGRTAGKMLGAKFGARLSHAPKGVERYLPMCLFSQAGVAIGLSILAAHRFPSEVGNVIVVVISATTVVVQIIGPLSTKWAVTKAGEVGLNITEDDLISRTRVEEIMDKDVPLIGENLALSQILKTLGESKNLYYPVVDADRHLLGIMTIDNLRDTFMASNLQTFLLAHDLMEPVTVVATPDMPISIAKDLLETHGLEYLPVVSEENRVLGLLELRRMKRFISRKVMELQRQAESLA